MLDKHVQMVFGPGQPPPRERLPPEVSIHYGLQRDILFPLQGALPSSYCSVKEEELKK